MQTNNNQTKNYDIEIKSLWDLGYGPTSIATKLKLKSGVITRFLNENDLRRTRQEAIDIKKKAGLRYNDKRFKDPECTAGKPSKEAVMQAIKDTSNEVQAAHKLGISVWAIQKLKTLYQIKKRHPCHNSIYDNMETGR